MSFAKKIGNKYGKKIISSATKTGINSTNKFGDKYGKKIIDTTKKQGMDFAKTAGKKIVQKNAEATGDLNGNKIADKITSLGNKPKSDEKEKEINEPKVIIIPSGKRQQVTADLGLF